jgi:hypothetical protein
LKYIKFKWFFSFGFVFPMASPSFYRFTLLSGGQ